MNISGFNITDNVAHQLLASENYDRTIIVRNLQSGSSGDIYLGLTNGVTSSVGFLLTNDEVEFRLDANNELWVIAPAGATNSVRVSVIATSV